MAFYSAASGALPPRRGATISRRRAASGLLLLSLAAAGGSEALLLWNSGTGVKTGGLHTSSYSFLTSTGKRAMCLFSKRPATSSEDVDTATDAQSDTQTEQKAKETNKIQRLTWNPLRLGVLRLGLTEPAMTSPLNYGKYDGTFTCAYCGATLFASTAKYDSGTGWPSFWRTAQEGAVEYKRDLTGLECHCARCDSHLGHVFLDGPRPGSVPQPELQDSPASDPRGSAYLPRYCINGAALNYKKREEEE